jgi:putative transposase
MTYNPDIHHRHSIRLRGFDYASAGVYFITVCVQGQECLFGEIVNREIRLNELGQVVELVWAALPDHYTNVELDECVIMPNHFHGIIHIVGAQFIAPNQPIALNSNNMATNKGAMNRAPTIGEIVRGFKARCTHSINIIRNNAGFPVWQRNYYERVVRNETELNDIRTYITCNPAKWADDTENPALPSQGTP